MTADIAPIPSAVSDPPGIGIRLQAHPTGALISHRSGDPATVDHPRLDETAHPLRHEA